MAEVLSNFNTYVPFFVIAAVIAVRHSFMTAVNFIKDRRYRRRKMERAKEIMEQLNDERRQRMIRAQWGK